LAALQIISWTGRSECAWPLAIEAIGNVAPEADLSALRPEADLREELDTDSIGFLNLIIALGRRSASMCRKRIIRT